MDLDILEKAILLLQKYQLTEISYGAEHSSLCIKRESLAITGISNHTLLPSDYNAVNNQICDTKVPKTDLSSPFTLVKASLVGTFYRATDPNSPPLCATGQLVNKGDPVGLIEAMKVLTVVSAPCSGTVVEICVENGQVVEYDQILFHISPSGMT